MNWKAAVKIMRPDQWYKNLFVFLVLFFYPGRISLFLVSELFLGFFALILVSSANYILNDLADEKRDKLCPEKFSRPLVSKSINRNAAIILFLILLFSSFALSWLTNVYLFSCCFSIFALTSLYTFYFKNVRFYDFIFISFNFILRAAAGGFIAGFYLGIGAITSIFCFSCFLILCKRYGEKMFFGENGPVHKPVLKYYSKQTLIILIRAFLCCLLLITAVFSLVYYKRFFFLFVPVFFFILFRYYYLVMNRKIIVTPNSVVRDKYLLISGGVLLMLAAAFLFVRFI
ncbi:MAG: UbiA family prenyltransferase [Candidatus Staskawiczbacteria bacterium]|jgi:4-hydroxybenzoate polyprenyltransferase